MSNTRTVYSADGHHVVVSQSVLGKVAKVLNVDVCDEWTITDADEQNNLYLAHFRQGTDMNKYGHIRGVIVDTEVEKIIATSNPYIPTVITNNLSENDNKLLLVDNNNKQHVLDKDSYTITPGLDGTMLRIFKNRGKIYYSTHRRLYSMGNPSFKDLYMQLNGPKEDELFNPDCTFSPYVHLFIIVHKKSVVCTKLDIGDGYLSYVGINSMWSVDSCPYTHMDKYDQEIKGTGKNVGYIDYTLHSPQYNTDENDSSLFFPKNMTIDEANKYLNYGFYEDECNPDVDDRLKPGEFVIIRKNNGELINVQSIAYSWRSWMCQNSTDLHQRLYNFIDYSYEMDNTKYKNNFPILKSFDIENIIKEIREGPIYEWDLGNEINCLNSPASKFYNIWMCMIMAVPLHQQLDVANLYRRLTNERKEVISQLKQNTNISKEQFEKLPTRARQIIETSKKDAQSSNNTKYLTDQRINHYISKERGDSLYRLVKYFCKI